MNLFYEIMIVERTEAAGKQVPSHPQVHVTRQ